MAEPVPLAAPDVTAEDRRAVDRVLATRSLSRGPVLRDLENELAALCERRHGVAVSSGTAALHCVLAGAGVGPSDQILLPSFTVPACANAVRAVGATPVYVEIESKTMAMSVADAESKLTPATRGILMVHPFGYPADGPAFEALARRHGLLLIEDACEAIGGRLGKRPLGSFGRAGVFGFYPNKQITSGEGGAVVCDDEALATRVRRYANQGRRMDGRWLDQDGGGLNYRLSDINAALARSQLSRLGSILERRRRIAEGYDERLRELPVELPPRAPDMSWFCYVIRVQRDRDDIVAALAGQNIQCGRYFAPLHQQPAFSHEPAVALPITETTAARTLALPFFNQISEPQLDRVCDALTVAINR